MAEVEYSERAVDQLEALDREAAERIVSKFDETSNFPGHFLKRLRNSPYYRLRVGDYRAEIDWRTDDDVLFVRRIGHRDGFYK